MSNVVGTSEHQEAEETPKSATKIQANRISGKPVHMDQQLYDLFFNPNSPIIEWSDIEKICNDQVRDPREAQQGNANQEGKSDKSEQKG